jgi:uncharacterized integral membrane protein
MSPWSAGLSQEARQALPQWNVLQWDGMAEFYPWRAYAARSMTAGWIPLWNPHVLAGTPFLANSQSAPLYPLHVLYYLPLGADTAVRMGWLAFIHLSLAGIFAYLLALDLGARPGAAVVGGATFELSGFAVAWLELPSFLSVACWIPLVLLCIGRAVRSQSWPWTAAAGMAAGMMLLGGHLQIAFYGLLVAGCVWLWEAIQGSGGGSGQWSPPASRVPGSGQSGQPGPTHHSPLTHSPLTSLQFPIVAMALAFALAAPQFLPSLELSRMSHRAGGPTAQGYLGYVELAMPLWNWITLLVPDYYGLPARGDFWGFWKYGPPNTMEYAGHVGAAAFVLVIIGLWWGRKITSRTFLFAGVAAIGLLLATGSPLCWPFYFFVPGFAQTGSPGRALVLFCLGQAMLAAIGLEWVLRQAEEDWKGAARAVLLGAAVAAALILALHIFALATQPLREPEVAAAIQNVTTPAVVRALLYAAVTGLLLVLCAWLFRENKAAHRIAALSTATLLLTAGGLLLLGGAYNLTAPLEMAYPETPLTRALGQVHGRVATLNHRWSLYEIPPALLPPNASLAYGWRDAQGYDSLYLGHYRRLADAVAGPGEIASPIENGNIVFIKHAHSRLLPLLAARYVVAQAPLTGSGLRPAPGFPPGPPYIYEYQPAVPEAYAVSDWTVEDDRAGLERLRKIGPSGLAGTAFVAPEEKAVSSRGSAGAPAAPAIVDRIAPGHLLIRVSPSVSSLLVLAESYAPGWKAQIRPATGPPHKVHVFRVNTAFQGVLVGPGPTTVEWRYEPASFRVGLFLALAALAGLITLYTGRPAGPSDSRRRQDT